eukprot:TRINITY_DN22132_c0_g1_i1.p1 TRINITY_DN22132_c0_g1~~TRINITY_DN22132_c0_g1_i1.p1  ORF type:complete len:1171 (+),score=379.70 TRINITY_DN22132_c0_g1_i1:91-3603(+)
MSEPTGQPMEQSSMDRMRGAVLKKQSDAMGAVGAAIARSPLLFSVIPWIVCLGLGFGVFGGDLITEPTELWVQKGGRLVEEKEFYDKHFYGTPRPLALQVIPKNRAGDNMMTKEYLDDAYEIDAQVMDMRPWPHPQLMFVGKCWRFTTKATCDSVNPADDAALCGWDDALGKCVFQDKFGVAPSKEQRGGALFFYKNVSWGWREVCEERTVPEVRQPGAGEPAFAPGGKSPISGLRAPCSTQMTPMDCFREHAPSQQTGSLQLLGWNVFHPVSRADTGKYGAAFGKPCHLWTGGINAKFYTIGGVHYKAGTNDTVMEKIEAFKMLYPIHPAEAFMNKYNNFIMKHQTSKVLYKQLGFPDNITLKEAEDIVEGFEIQVGHHFDKGETQKKFPESFVTYTSEFHLQDTIDSASTRNQSFVLIGFALLFVVAASFLFRCSLVKNRIALGLWGVLTVACSVFAAMGLTAIFGVDFNGLTLQVLPFIAMGLGIDDMFVILHYFSESPHEDVETRMRRAYSHAGPAVLATTFTNMAVFFLGCAIPIKAVQDFSIAAGISEITNFTLVVFSFGGVLVLDAYRIKSKRYDMVPCVRDHGYEFPAESKGMLAKFVEKIMAPAYTKLPIAIVFVVLSMGILGGGIYGCTQLELGLSVWDFMVEGTPERHYFDVRDRYFPNQANIVIGKQADWHTRENQVKVNTLVQQTLLHPKGGKDIFDIDGGKMNYADPTFLPTGVSWTQAFRRYALQYPGGQDPENDCSCYPAAPLPNPTDAAAVQRYKLATLSRKAWDSYVSTTLPNGYELKGLKDLNPNCTINPDRYYELLHMFFGLSTCTESGVAPATAHIRVHDPKYFLSAKCRVAMGFKLPNGAPDNRPYEAPTCKVSESSFRADNTPFIPNDPEVSPIPPLGVYGYGVLGPYVSDVQWVDSKDPSKGIKAWKTGIVNYPVSNEMVQSTINMIEETREVLDAESVPVFATGLSYYFGEQYRFVREYFRNLVILSICLALVITWALSGSLTIALIQTVVIGASVTVIVALIPLMSLQLNYISLSSVVFGTAINLELSIHICKAFLVAQSSAATPYERRQDRIVIAITEMALPVFDGALTSFFSTLILVASDVAFFRKYFFVLYSMMILVSMWYSFVFLPIMLCWFGPDVVDVFEGDLHGDDKELAEMSPTSPM